jgi:hypothetical protein
VGQARNEGLTGQEADRAGEGTTVDTEVRERLAAYAHMAWAGWMAYLFGKCQSHADGSVTIPAWAVERWVRQMLTLYEDLPVSEQVSDLVEADKILQIVTEASK